MERQIREIEQEMKHLSGERLEERMNTYQRLTAAFERENGYACESEITGVLKGLGFTEEEFAKPVATLSGGQKTRVLSSKTAPHKAGYSAFGRANQPFGFKFYLMAGNLSSELSRCSTDRLS